MSSRAAVITGIGLVGPTGIGHEPFWDALQSGRSAVRAITRFDASEYPCRVAGEVDDAHLELLVEPRKLRTVPRATQLALAATTLAIDDARLDRRLLEPSATSVVIGTAMGGWSDAEAQAATFLERGARRVNPFIVSGSGNHGPGVEMAAAVRAQGPQLTFSAGCPSSLQAVAHSAAMIEAGLIDVCLSGGTEAPLSPLGFAALCRTRELATGSDAAIHASRPFDVRRTGMVLSEGSCVLVLEALEHAQRRGARIYASVSGGDGSCDAEGLHGLDSEGASGAAAIQRLLDRSKTTPRDLDYVCSHANSSAAFDRKDVAVLRKAFGDAFWEIPISSPKGVTGHAFGASGAFQVAATCLAIRNSRIPPTANLEQIDEACRARHVMGSCLDRAVNRALVTSYGYGGINSYLVLQAPLPAADSTRVD
jgi:3-oxoacyl-[acyl-carrier-protein] synthase II